MVEWDKEQPGAPPPAWAPPPEPGPPPNPYGYGYGGYGPSPGPDPVAIVALVLAIVGAVFCPPLFGLAAVVCGLVSRSRIRKSGGALTGDGLAIASIVVGGLEVLATIARIAALFLPSGAWSF